MSKYTNEQIVTAAREAVAEKGAEYVYIKGQDGPGGACMYATADLTPSCIVGHILAKIDPFEFGRIAAWERGEAVEGTAIYEAITELGLAFTSDQQYALRAAQNFQDAGKPWGQALEYIEKLEVAS